MQKMLATGLLLIFPLLSSFSVADAETLSKNDQLFLEDLQYRLDIRLQNQVMAAINGYKAKIATMDKIKARRLTDSILQKLETILYRLRAAQPLDKSLEKKADSKYLAYMLVKFELLLLR